MLIFQLAMLECRNRRTAELRPTTSGECLACQAMPVLGDLEKMGLVWKMNVER